MLNRIALQHDWTMQSLHYVVALSFLLLLIAALAAALRQRGPYRWWPFIGVLGLAAFFMLSAFVRAVFGPWPSMDDSPAEAARLRVTLTKPRRVGPFTFPAATVLQYWREASDELDWADLPGPANVMPGLTLIGHMSQTHAVSGWTVHLASDQVVNGLPCAKAQDVTLNPQNGHLMGCDLTHPTRYQGWLCTSVWMETDGRLHACGADPEVIHLPSGTYPAGTGWETFGPLAESAGVLADAPLILNQPAISFRTKYPVTVDLLQDGEKIDRIRTSPEEGVPFRGALLGHVIEWQYSSQDRYSKQPLGSVTALRGELSQALQCSAGAVPAGVQVEIPLAGNDVRRWPAGSEWPYAEEEEATPVKGCALKSAP